jgi:hypothetical protein
MNKVVVGGSARAGSGMTTADGIGLNSKSTSPVRTAHHFMHHIWRVFDRDKPDYAALPAVTHLRFTSVYRTIDFLTQFLYEGPLGTSLYG